MPTTSTPATANASALQAAVTTGGTAAPAADAIAPEQQHHVDAILAMDPMQVPMPYDIPEGALAGLSLRLTALPPAMQHEVAAKLAASGPMNAETAKVREAELTAAAIRDQRARTIAKVGVGRDATPYHRELAHIAREVGDLNAEHDRLQDELSRVLRYETKADPVTGEPMPVPVYAVTGERAEAYVARQHDLERQIRLLVGDGNSPGLEGAKRMRRALAESVAARVELQRQVDEEAGAKAEAEAINRRKRISERAESLARLQRNGD
jgi:hypothetical protein